MALAPHRHLIGNGRAFHFLWHGQCAHDFSCNVALADAWATVVCNEIQPGNLSVFDRVNPNNVRGVFAIMREQHVTWGVLLPVVSADVNERLISAGDR